MLKDLSFVKFKPGNESAIFEFNAQSPMLQGRDMLIQMIIKRIFTQRGSNRYDQNVGTNFPKAFGTVDLEQVDAIANTFPVMIRNLEDQIKDLQLEFELSGGEIPEPQKLVSLSLINAEFDQTLGGWLLDIGVETETNEFTLSIP